MRARTEFSEMKTVPLEEFPATFGLLEEINRGTLNSWLDDFIKVLTPAKLNAKTDSCILAKGS